ncbi:Sterol O-acyltransferase 2 (Sterol-ester synthase 2) [Paraconiothyrium brasiliense]|uniref:O-acyltransferase n=1 Tax=Paraconiothyrium brasiliense TaxID=300254 RepID=A0ABR3R927_9PLEO
MAESTSIEATPQNGHAHVHEPRARKPTRIDFLRPRLSDETIGTNGQINSNASGTSSGRTTPIPENAPPSVKATSSARRQVRAEQRRRIFPTIEYVDRVSHFDPSSDYRDFRGFFVLFWIGLAIMVITAMLRNYKETGYPLNIRQWNLFKEKVFELAICDGLMYTATPTNTPRFYNGHLSETRRRLNDLDNPDNVSKAAAYRYPGSRTHLQEIPQSPSDEHKEDSEKGRLAHLREDLALELTSPLGHVSYPQNLTIANFTDFIFCPTLCYELEYPRVQSIRWSELFYKTLAVFGCIFLLTITTEEFILPVLDESAIELQASTSPLEFALILSETIGRLLFPFMVAFLLVFLVIFEYILGAFAEITRFADRQFFADWWNSCDWLEFSREWNKPVHHFFRRHVYSASRGHMSRPLATTITFFISALAHELVMGCITRKFRGYGFIAMMLQMPIVLVQRSKWVKGRTLLNNVLFWCSMILGLAMMCALYVLV